MSTNTSQAPRYSVVPDEIKETPITPELFLEQQLELYLKSAPEKERKLLQDRAVHESVLLDLSGLVTLMPILDRISAVTEVESRRLGVEDVSTFKDTIIMDRIKCSCQLALKEAENQELKRENIELKAENKIDPLTQLANKKGYHEKVDGVLELAKRSGLPVWCFMMDIDDFRHVNNDYGHLAGDQVLQEVGRRLKGQTRASDFVARFGGEEFIALVYADEDGARAAISRVVDAIGQQPFVVRTNKGVKKLKITLSAGGSRFRVEEEDERMTLEERADQNLYLAKNSGKNQAFLDNAPATAKDL